MKPLRLGMLCGIAFASAALGPGKGFKTHKNAYTSGFGSIAAQSRYAYFKFHQAEVRAHISTCSVTECLIHRAVYLGECNVPAELA